MHGVLFLSKTYVGFHLNILFLLA